MKESEKTVRLSLRVTPEFKAKIERLRERSDSATLTELLRRSLAVYGTFVDVQESGGRLYAEDEAGNREAILLPLF